MSTLRIAALLGATILGAGLLAACGDGTPPAEETPAQETPAAQAPAGPVVVEGFSTPESVVYDPENDRYLVGNVGGFGDANDGFISAINPDGSIQDMEFIRGTDAAPLNSALGTAVHQGRLYVADSPFVRVYDLATGDHVVSHEIPDAAVLNDLDVADDGTIYVSDMGTEEPDTWAIFMISPEGDVSEFARGADLQRPNGLEIDPQGRIVAAGVAAPMLSILSPADGLVELTITLPDGGYDGVVPLEDGFIVSAPFASAIYRVGLDGTATPIGDGIASPASIGYDDTRNRLLIPQLQANTVTILPLD
jgi:hypothetical protein